MTDTTINPGSIPYEQLALIGITKERFDTLPPEVKQTLLGGEVTPLVQTAIKLGGDRTVYVPAKLQLARGENGELTLVTYPVRREVVNDLRLAEGMIERLKQGEVIRQGLHYLQLDPETKSIIRVPESKVEDRLYDVQKLRDIDLGQQQKEAIRNGRPVELEVGGERVTVGVDLREPQMFKVMKGDLHEWERQQKLAYDEDHPEYIGLVQTDRNRWEYQQIVNAHSQGVTPDNIKPERSAGIRR